MASFSLGFESYLGDPLLMDILSQGSQNHRVTWWGGVSDQHWQESQKPDAM